MGDKKAHGYWWPALLVLVLAACGLLTLRGVQRLDTARAELGRIQEVNQRLDRENQVLYRTVLRLRGDPQAIERAARLKMDLVRADEVVYQEGGRVIEAASSGQDQP